jgi:hypothetical protein
MHRDPGIWVDISKTAWWQLLVVVVTALLTQYFGHVFLGNRKKREAIIDAASRMISYGRQIRGNLSLYKQSELMFEEAQNHLAAALKDKDTRVFDYQRAVVMVAHDDMAAAQLSYEDARNKFIEASYLLVNMCYERLGEPNNKELSRSINKLIDPQIGKFDTIAAIKDEIDKRLVEPMYVVEEACGYEVYLQNRSIWRPATLLRKRDRPG